MLGAGSFCVVWSALAGDCDQEIGAQAKDLAWGWTGSSLASQSLPLPSY
mgnify:CR=1 FL=1